MMTKLCECKHWYYNCLKEKCSLQHRKHDDPESTKHATNSQKLKFPEKKYAISFSITNKETK